MNNEELANELNDVLSEFYNTICNPSKSCTKCEIFKYRNKYSTGGECVALYLAAKLLGATEDTAIFINKQHIVFKATVCTDKGFNYCSNECYIRNIKKRHTDNELGGSHGSCFYTYLGTILLNDI